MTYEFFEYNYKGYNQNYIASDDDNYPSIPRVSDVPLMKI